jgi:PAS domain S-box-containing protein
MGESLRDKIEALRRQNTELEATRRRAEESYRRLIEDQRELICRFLPNGTVTFVNDAFCRYFGKTREELIGHFATPLVPEEDRPLVSGALARLSREVPVVEIEHRIITPGGEIRWLNWRERALFNDAGKIAEFQSLGLDVTDRKRAEEQAARSEALARLVKQQNLELSTPLIPIADRVLAMPLIGRIDEERAARVLETVLEGVVRERAETVLLDVTGVTLLDTQVAAALMRTAKAVALLGARAVLTGIQPHVAQTLVAMGLEVQGLITLRSLKEGITWAMRERDAKGAQGARGARAARS